MRLTVLSVAYPLAPVYEDAVGGAEQVLVQLDRALMRAGHRSMVLAPEGSTISGELIPVPPASDRFCPQALPLAERATKHLLDKMLQSHDVDLVHIHALHFAPLLPEPDFPTLVTLHLPRNYYAENDLRIERRNLWMNCVSRAQHATFDDLNTLARPIENGVAADAEAPFTGDRTFALWLGRICPEKAVHLAIEACERAGASLMIAGRTFPCAAHLKYFLHEVAPRLRGRCMYVGPASGEHKRRLLRHARCVIVTTLVPETSSLVAREALAAGTPVVAIRSPALEDLIEHGRTGYLVQDVAELVEGIQAAGHLDPRDCVLAARQRCSFERTAHEYLQLYESVARRGFRRAAGQS